MHSTEEKVGLDFTQVSHYAGHVSTNTSLSGQNWTSRTTSAGLNTSYTRVTRKWVLLSRKTVVALASELLYLLSSCSCLVDFHERL